MISLNTYKQYINKSIFNLSGASIGNKAEIIIVPSNIDDIFRHLQALGVEEIEVDRDQMGLLAQFVASTSGSTEIGAKALIEGKVSSFFGIKVFLE